MRDEIRITFNPFAASPDAVSGLMGTMVAFQLDLARAVGLAMVAAQAEFVRGVVAAAITAGSRVAEAALPRR